MDFRDYQVGDDLRHVDWRTYARTDQMKVRLYREEITPILDVVVDRSASMAVTATKARAAQDLVDAVFWLARRAGGTGRLWAAGGERLSPDVPLAFDGPPQRTHEAPRAPLRPRGLRLWLSDFLVPGDPAPAIRKLAAGASHLYVLQVLDPWELEPTADGPRTLVDCEDDARLDLVLDARALATYRERLHRLQGAVAEAVRRVGGTYASVRADRPDAMLRRDLLPQGVVQPA
jgi:uncharacterized protein (DUF58 family)